MSRRLSHGIALVLAGITVTLIADGSAELVITALLVAGTFLFGQWSGCTSSPKEWP